MYLEKRILSYYLAGHLALHCAVIASPDTQTLNSHVEMALQHAGASANAKNSNGLTPLHLAFSLRRIMAAKALVKAGADPTARDNTGRNMLHHILFGDRTKILTLSNLFRALCDILDPELIKQLAIQRTYAASKDELGWGLHTPLSSWIYWHMSSKNNGDMLRMILKTTGGKELYIMDGTGNYPIHQAVRSLMVQLAEVMLEFDPALAQLENATGVTPLELSGSKLLDSQLSHSSELSWGVLTGKKPSRRNDTTKDYGSQHKNNDSKAESTDARDPSPFSSLDSPERQMWELLSNTVSGNQSKRKLVSIHDANLLVKRLDAKRTARHNPNLGSGGDRKDESVEWLRRWDLTSSFEVDKFQEEEEERKKAREKRKYSQCA